MQFSLKEFEVKAGEEVELEFKNAGKYPKCNGYISSSLTKVSAIAFGGKAMQAE